MALSRRAMLASLGGLALGSALAAPFEQAGPAFGWAPRKLDPAACAKTAYAGYWHEDYGGGCGTFYAIVGSMAEQFGAPCNQFPFTMMEVGKSGISDRGTICGALPGVACAYALFWGRKERNPMVTELLRWYEQTAFPVYDPGQAAKGAPGPLPASRSGSVLCHMSVSRWCFSSKIAEGSKQRNERCARVTADVAQKGIAILNAKIDGAFAPAGTSEAVASCGDCHGRGKTADDTKGLMDCKPCHSGSEHTQDKFRNHPS